MKLFRALIFFTLITATAAQAKPKPSVVRTHLAGVNLTGVNLTGSSGTNFFLFDSRQGYYLARQLDGLGHTMVIDLKLTPLRKGLSFSEGDPTHNQIRQAHLPHLKDGTGVNIGDSPTLVAQKIGAPPKKQSYEPELKTRIFIYAAPITFTIDNERVKWDYRGVYTFKNERLWAIEYEAREPKSGSDSD